ncbi:MAG TPA: hypothetical protein VK820_01340, partial [Steroidobacteraceae bacterium]|nr:hypothetical protein [Steroidobacteraceae bacterium]
MGEFQVRVNRILRAYSPWPAMRPVLVKLFEHPIFRPGIASQSRLRAVVGEFQVRVDRILRAHS